MLGYATKRRLDARLVCGDAGQLPFANESFELLYCVNSFHHFRDKEDFIREARRLLRPGGAVAIIGMDPLGQRDEWYVYDYFERTREFDTRRFPPISAIDLWIRKSGFEEICSRIVERIVNYQYGRSGLKHSAAKERHIRDVGMDFRAGCRIECFQQP